MATPPPANSAELLDREVKAERIGLLRAALRGALSLAEELGDPDLGPPLLTAIAATRRAWDRVR